MSLSENLKRLRNHKGLTQEEVSKYLKMNRATYAHYETGRREPDVATLKLLADFFNVTTDELLSEYSPDENGPENSDIRNPYKDKEVNHTKSDELIEYVIEEAEKHGYNLKDKSKEEIAKIIVKALKIDEISKSN